MAESDKRLRYYNGQFLEERDFTDEQKYHLDRQRRHNRQLHTYGIAEGLTVTANNGASSVNVSSGTAIDGEGRMIVLAESRSVAFGSLTDQWVLVVISYQEQSSDPATVGDEGDTRWLERPDIEVVAESAAPPEDLYIRLARLELAGNGTVSQHDMGVRNSAGKLSVGTLKVQGALNGAPQFVQDQNGKQSRLAIGTENVGIGTKDPGYVLTIAGNISSNAMVEARSEGDEASIRYVNNNGGVWHAGTGGIGGAKNFFFWNNEKQEAVVTITPAGSVLIVGTVDGRDIAADGAQLDAHRGSTDNPHNTTAAQVGAITGVSGVSNPGGNIDLVGQAGIIVTGDDAVKKITIENAAGTLNIQGPLGDKAQFVQDQVGNQSPLAIGTGRVGIGTKDPDYVLTIAGNISSGAMMEARSEGDEASIRYMNNNGGVWHAGVGPANNFFLWNPTSDAGAMFTPEGVLAAKGLKADTDIPGIALAVAGDASNHPIAELRSAGNEASIRYNDNDGVSWRAGTGGVGGAENFFFWNDQQEEEAVVRITPAGDILVAGTVDGRDIAADGVKLDTHTGSTNNPHKTTAAQVGAITGVGGVSNPGGNIGLAGEAGITVTGDNNNKTITISNTPGSLTTQSSIGPSAQFVRDQSGNQSSLSISTGKVGVGTKTPGFIFTVAGDIAEWPLAEVHNVNNEASIRFLNLNDKLPWHVGSGGQAGKENFFFSNESQGVVAKITPGGVLSVKGIQAGTEAAGIVFTVEGKNGTAPVAEVKNGGNEASVRYSCTDPVAWHVGLGGHGGAGSFFFWNDSAKGVVATLQKDGTLTVNGGLNVKTLATVSTAPDSSRLRSLKIDPLTGQIYRDN